MERPQTIVYLLLVVFLGALILTPDLFYIDRLSQGDHGRDLYSFKKTFEGGLPYVDYSSQNGPLMPYYYSLFYALNGVSIQSILIGYALLTLLSGVMIFLICSVFFNPRLSALAALWYWAFREGEFFYTFNHAGAVLGMLCVLLFLFKYLSTTQSLYLVPGVVFALLTALVRPNIGLAVFVGLVLSIMVYAAITKDRKPKQALRAVLLFLFVGMIFSAGVYFILCLRTPRLFALKDIAYWRFIEISWLFKNIRDLGLYFLYLTWGSWPARAVTLILGALMLRTFFVVRSGELASEGRKSLLAAIVSLVLFGVLVLMEYLLGTRGFRWIWAMTPAILLMFFFIETGLTGRQAVTKGVIYLVLLLVAGSAILRMQQARYNSMTPEQLLDVGPHRVFLSGGQKSWIKVVEGTSAFIMKNTAPSEKIAAIPYDSLYYFLTGRDSATVELFAYVTGERERRYLQQLQENDVRYVILSNRSQHDAEGRAGILGQDFGQELYQYIQSNYHVVAGFGDWGVPAGWVTHHATRILRRNH